MDKYEVRRRRYLDFLAAFYPERGGIPRLEKDSGIDSTYLRRMRYETSKKGFKRIGEDTVEKLEAISPHFKHWFTPAIGDMNIEHSQLRDRTHANHHKGAALLLSDNSRTVEEHGLSTKAVVRPFVKLFPNVDLHRYLRLEAADRLRVQEAMNDQIALAELRASERNAASGKR